jgi:hypothetical protein
MFLEEGLIGLGGNGIKLLEIKERLPDMGDNYKVQIPNTP